MNPSTNQPFLFPGLQPPLAAPKATTTPDQAALAAEPPGETGADIPSLHADEGDDMAAPAESVASELVEWKDALREDFETWLASLEVIPELDPEADSSSDAPDLYSFYEQFAAANAESRKSNRRTAEAISQWGETLLRFENSLTPLRETTAQLAAVQPKEGQMSRAHCLVLVEMLDRMHRLNRAFQSPPIAKKAWWGGGGDAAWRKAWESQHQALDILVSHVEGLLKQEGVTRLDTTGQPFDPAVMMAVAAEPDATRPPQTVLEELAAGYRRHGELLRAAHVKVTRKP